MIKGFIYLIESIKNKKRYLGSTNNPVIRISEHNRGYVKATRINKPWKYLMVINIGSLKEAREIEYYIKRQELQLTVRNVIKILNWYYEKGC